LVATGNLKKRHEIMELLEDLKDVEVLNFKDLPGPAPMVVENGKTFRENAIKKAVIASRFFDGLVIADDSGLEVEALGGKPGVRSARFARAKATDQENNEKLLKLLERIPENHRQARFVCHITLARTGTLLENFEGVVEGRVAAKPKGKNGFGYDPIFIPEGHDKTFGQITAEYKNRISHRGQALQKLKGAIGKYLA
jgi:XTP/dITP diphosphohydrolase